MSPSSNLFRRFKVPGWVLPTLIAIPLIAGANGGGSKPINTSAAREAFRNGDFATMRDELDILIRDLGRDTLRQMYANALLLQSEAAEAEGNTAVSLKFLKRYNNLNERIDASHNRFAVGALVIIIMLVFFIARIISDQEAIMKKNEALSKLLAESTGYKEKEYLDAEDIPDDGPAPDIQAMTSEELYSFLHTEILGKKLFLNPGFGRQTLMDDYSLSKEKIGKAFSAYGTSLPQFINTCRLEYACSLMKRDREMNVTDVASSSGFTTRESFSRSFKQQYALTPSEYRDNLGCAE